MTLEELNKLIDWHKQQATINEQMANNLMNTANDDFAQIKLNRKNNHDMTVKLLEQIKNITNDHPK